MGLIEILTSLKSRTDDSALLTEADVRAQIIDPLLRELGWTDTQIKREPYAGWADSKGFIDYLIFARQHATYVVEAKKTGRTFDVPSKLLQQGQTTYQKLLDTGSGDLVEALNQCVRYGIHSGAVFACATNGRDFIFFKIHHRSRPLAQAKAVLFAGPEDILRRLDEFCDLFERSKVEFGRAERHLVGREMVAPTHSRRLSASIGPPPEQSAESEEYSKLLEMILRGYILEVKDDKTFSECYVSVPVNRTTNANLEALIANQEAHIGRLRDAQQFAKELTEQPGLPDVASGKTVVLHGPIGVGKSSLIRHLKHGLPPSPQSLWVTVDLIDFKDHPFDAKIAGEIAALLGRKVRDRVADEASSLGRNSDPDEWRHLRDIYNTEVTRFQRSKYPDSDDTDPEYIREVRDYIWKLRESDPQEHLSRTLRWLTNHCKIPVVLVLDNSDQLGLDFQEFLFKLADGIQNRTSAITVVSLRTEALVSHRMRAHAMATVIDKYEVRRPPLLEVLRKRFAVVQKRIGDLTQKSAGYRIAIERLEALIDTLLDDAGQGGEASAVLESVGNGNLRRALEAVACVFRPDQRTMDLLVAKRAKRQRTTLSASFVRRCVLRGRAGRYSGDDVDCLVPNIYQGEVSLQTPQTLALRLLQHIAYRAYGGELPAVGEVISEFAMAGIDGEFLRRLLSRLRNLELLAVPHMNRDMSEGDGVKLTPLGLAMIQDWFRDPDYLTATGFDTLIYREDVFLKMISIWRDQRLPAKTRFTLLQGAFAEYLLDDDDDLRNNLTVDLLSPVVREKLRMGHEPLHQPAPGKPPHHRKP